MAKKKIAIVTPTRDGLVDINYTNTVYQTQKILGDEYNIELSLMSGVSDISAGRNKIFNVWYYNTDVEYLLWVDSDISFSPLDLKKMLEYDVDVIGGNYAKKQIEVKTLLETAALMQRMDGQVDAQSCLEASLTYVVGGSTSIMKGGDKDGLATCEMLGMGLMLMKREAADKLVAWCDDNMTKKKWAWNNDFCEGYPVFDPWVNERNENLAEDFAFCTRLKEAGIKLWFHPKMKIRHSGYMSFDGDFQQVVELALKAHEAGEQMPGTNYEKTSWDEKSDEKSDEKNTPEFVD